LNPVVFTLAMLLAMMSIIRCWAIIPLAEVRKPAFML
jgi:hypothetical protein